MKNNKKLFLFGVISVITTIFIISIISFIIAIVKNNNSNNNKYIKIYYYDKLNNNLSYEEKILNLRKDTFVDDIFKEMKSAPKSSNLKSTIPKELTILNYNLSDYNLHINFSNHYNKLSDVEKLILRASFVWTITEINFVNNVKIYVDNIPLNLYKDLDFFNRNNIILNPVISPDKIEREKVTLYFANQNNKLIEENRHIEVKQNKSMELYIVEELIKGPKNDKNIKTIPSETKIRNIKTEDSICYVDLSSDFITKLSSNKNEEKLAIYSIVNSLTNLNTVNKVQFLIDGEKMNLNNNSIDISQPLGRYESIIETKNN
nr:GerMN domain-containing protein [uncultured Tyzzerella sp.]